MTDARQKHVIVVLGMHRGGTSVITRGLEVLGVHLGDRLLAPDPHNAKGYWEDPDVNALNIALLGALGHDWHTLSPVVPEEQTAPAVGRFKLRAVELLRNKLASVDCFGLKDPRFPRLLVFWRDVFTHLQARVSYVIACRNPMSVARSLAARDGFDIEKGYYLWLEHMLGSVTHTAKQIRIVVDYDRLMEEPLEQMQRMARGLGLPFDPDGPAFDAYRTSFLDDSLRHARYRLEDLYAEKASAPGVIPLYRMLLELAADQRRGDHPAVMSFVERMSEQFREFHPALRYMQTCEARSSKFASQLAERDEQIAGLRQAVAERDEQIADLGQAVAGLTQAVAERDGHIVALRSSTSWRMTAPVRIVACGLRSLLRNSGATPSPDQSPGTARFSRLVRASLPYYRRFVPVHVKAMVPHRVREAAMRRLGSGRIDPADDGKGAYHEWILRNDTLSDEDRSLILSHIAAFQYRPKLSVLMPVYNTPPEFLGQAIESVIGQLYREWELCVVDDASQSTGTRSVVERYARKDDRIRAWYRPTNGGISACTNTALEMASGDWIVLMDHDDVLSEHALYLLAEAIDRNPEATIIYSDEDNIDGTGRRCFPFFKPDWDYDLFVGQNLINHLAAYRADLARRVGGVREGFEGSQDWDFALRVIEAALDARVHHVPFVLYHRREWAGTFSGTSLDRARDAAERAVNEHFERTKQAAVATPEGHSSYLRIKRALPAERPPVSIVIPTKDRCGLLRTCLDGLLNRTHYEPVEIVVVDNGSTEPATVALLADIGLRDNVEIVEDSRPFNFSRLVNLGVAVSSGKVCVLLNNDIDVINPRWLEELVSHALRPEVGAVGAKLYYGNDTIQHGGVILGVGGVAGHAHRFLPRNSPGYFGRLNLTHRVSCVTAACLATRREVYDEIGGFNEHDLAVAYNDVDFCLRLRQAGYEIIWTPEAELYHYESRSRGYETTPAKLKRCGVEGAYMRHRWARVLDHDPFYNPNLSLASETFELSARTRARKPWLEFAAASRPQGPQEERGILVPPLCKGR